MKVALHLQHLFDCNSGAYSQGWNTFASYACIFRRGCRGYDSARRSQWSWYPAQPSSSIFSASHLCMLNCSLFIYIFCYVLIVDLSATKCVFMAVEILTYRLYLLSLYTVCDVDIDCVSCQQAALYCYIYMKFYCNRSYYCILYCNIYETLNCTLVQLMFVLDIHWFYSGCRQSISDSANLHCWTDSDVQGPQDGRATSAHFCCWWQCLPQHASISQGPVHHYQVIRVQRS